MKTYRRDLDGLRGVAIALVVIFHVFVGRVSGGVDVFLMLSGFFFLGSQLRYAAKPGASLNPWWPLWRILRRLLPALLTVLFITSTVVFFFTPQLLNQELVRQLTATLGYYLNWELIAQDSAYAAASVDTSPLQHLWSMSVQGQFYLFAIAMGLIFAWIAMQNSWDFPQIRRLAGPILVLITLASFAYASRDGLISTPHNYYSTFSRAWELTLGAVLALYYRPLPSTLRAPAAAAGLILIAITGIVIADTFAFPGPVALMPIGGAILVVLSAGEGRTGVALGSAPAQWLGRVAYSLYLWHWPLLIVSTSMLGTIKPPFWLGVLVIIGSLLLADATHRFIESPLRQKITRPTIADTPLRYGLSRLKTTSGQLHAASGVGLASIFVLMLSFQPWYEASTAAEAAKTLNVGTHPGALALHGAIVPEAEVAPDPNFVGDIYTRVNEDFCMSNSDSPTNEIVTVSPRFGTACVYGDREADTTVVLAGSSHAGTLIEPLAELGQEHGFRVIPMLRPGCPIIDGYAEQFRPECTQWSAYVMDRIVEMNPAVVVSTTTRPSPLGTAQPEFVHPNYVGFWEVLRQADIAFLGLRDNPWMLDENLHQLLPNQCLVEQGPENTEACAMPRERMYNPTNPADEVLAAFDNAVSVDTADWYCTDSICPAVVGNIPVYRDQNHISNAYAISTAPLLWEELEAILH